MQRINGLASSISSRHVLDCAAVNAKHNRTDMDHISKHVQHSKGLQVFGSFCKFQELLLYPIVIFVGGNAKPECVNSGRHCAIASFFSPMHWSGRLLSHSQPQGQRQIREELAAYLPRRTGGMTFPLPESNHLLEFHLWQMMSLRPCG